VLDRLTIAAALRELALLFSLKGENRFKIRAYENGAAALEQLDRDLGELVRKDRLSEIEGIGQSLASLIRELWNTGSAVQLERLRTEIPRGVVELSRIDGIGEARMRTLHLELGISSLEELEAAIAAGRIRTLKGFGPKTEAKLKEAIERYRRTADRLRLLDALAQGDRLLRHARLDTKIAAVEIAGELRRRLESVDTIDLVAGGESPAAAVEHFVRQPEVLRIESRSDEEASVRLASGVRARVRSVAPTRFAAALVEETGSPAHVAKLAERAKGRGLELASLEASDEGALYEMLGLAWIPPELREDAGEIEQAADRSGFDLVRREDVRGAVHCHTRYSDGAATIREMAEAAVELGFEYLTITDHSPTAKYAGGLELDRLKQQWDEIAEVQETVRVRLLRGTESDILADGALDYPDEVLEKLDIVIASIHTRHKLDEDAMTERIIRAMRHPMFKIWGHALGRLVLKRDPIACNMERILDVIASVRAAIEINGDPDRLELEPRWIRAAKERGIKFVISPDAHSTRALRYVSLGVDVARRGGVGPTEVLNAMRFEEFRRAVKPA
jgi:DNA polymerase (family X)